MSEGNLTPLEKSYHTGSSLKEVYCEGNNESKKDFQACGWSPNLEGFKVHFLIFHCLIIR